MVCMALFVRYMYTAAVLHCGNLPAAFFVHTNLPMECETVALHFPTTNAEIQTQFGKCRT